MYPNPIVLEKAPTVDVTFDFRGSTIDASQYRDVAATLDLEHGLSIRHQVTNKGSNTQTRNSVIRFDRIVENEQGVQGTLSVYLVVRTPEKVATMAQLTEQLTLMQSFLNEAGFIDRIKAGEI